MLPDCRSLFDQFERSPPSHVLTNSKSTEPDHHNAVLLDANDVPSPLPEYHCVIDLAIPVAKPRFFTYTLKSKHSSYWCLAAFEHFDQNTNTSLCFTLFEASLVPEKYKIYQPVMAPKVKKDYRRPKYYNLKMRMRQNCSVDGEDKHINKLSTAVLGDSLRFTAGVSAHCNLIMSMIDVINCFQNTMRGPTDPVYVNLPPYYRQWFENIHPKIKLLDSKYLFVQLFNVCQGGVDAGKLWSGHFDRVLSKLNVHRSMRGIAVYARIIDNELIILNVSTDGILVCTKSTTVRSN